MGFIVPVMCGWEGNGVQSVWPVHASATCVMRAVRDWHERVFMWVVVPSPQITVAEVNASLLHDVFFCPTTERTITHDGEIVGVIDGRTESLAFVCAPATAR